MRSRLAIALVLLAAVAGCGGDSKADKAMASVCSARDDITKQVDTLAGMTITTATTSQAGSALTAIKDDLGKIADARKDLSDDRRSGGLPRSRGPVAGPGRALGNGEIVRK